MHTTVTLDPDVEALLRRVMQRRGLSFEAAVNEAIRAGLLADRTRAHVEFPTYSLGAPMVDVTKALQLAAELEDEEVARGLARGQ